MKNSAINQADRILLALELEKRKQIDGKIASILKGYNFDEEADRDRFIQTWYSWSIEDQRRMKEFFSDLKKEKPELYHPFLDDFI